jgi:hypothetical protein
VTGPGPPLEPGKRREQRRYPLGCLLRLFREGEVIEGRTSEVSSEGFSFHSGLPFAPGECFACELVVAAAPATDERDALRLLCRARVVRSLPLAQGGAEVACLIDEYSIAPLVPAPPAASRRRSRARNRPPSPSA